MTKNADTRSVEIRADELVRRVADAINFEFDTLVGHKDGPEGWKHYVRYARAAMRGMAEWLDESHQLDNDGQVSLALRKALKAKE